MCKCIKRIICLLVVGVSVFFALALWSGGEKFRWFGEKTGGAIKESSEKLGEKADEIKGKKDEAAKTMEKFTSIDKEEAKHTSSDSSANKVKKPEDGSAEEGGNQTAVDSLRSFWKSVRKKISALGKG
jgi:hypothetical protein